MCVCVCVLNYKIIILCQLNIKICIYHIALKNKNIQQIYLYNINIYFHVKFR